MRNGPVAFRRAHSGIVRLSPAVMCVLLAHRQLGEDEAEAGGLLLGRFFEDRPDVLIDEASVPTKTDRRSRFAISRRKEEAQKLVDAAWTASGGTRNFLGEWHSHPEPSPSPSCRDRLNWGRISRRAVYEQDGLVFVIVGTEEVKAWEVRRDGTRVALGSVSVRCS